MLESKIFLTGDVGLELIDSVRDAINSNTGFFAAANGDDHGNTAATATAVVVPSTTAGNLESASDEDWFSFDANFGDEYTFETTLDTLGDSQLRLYAEDGTLVAQDDDGGIGFASKIDWTASAGGTFFLSVIPYSTNQGTYSLHVSGPTAGVQAFTLQIATQSILESGGITRGTVTRAGSTDTPLDVALTNSDPTEAVLPSRVTIPIGDVAATFTIRGVDDNIEDGTQTVTVTASASGFSDAVASFQVLDDEQDDHGDSNESATRIGVPSTSSGIIDPQSSGVDEDWFAFQAVNGTAYLFETTLGTLNDSKLRLYDSNGVQIVEDDDGGEGLASRIRWTAPGSGTYFLSVVPFAPFIGGSYTLNVSTGTSTGGGGSGGDGGGGGSSTPQSLTLAIAQGAINENGGTSLATLTRSGSTANSLVVTLSNSDTTEASVPSQVTIAPGSSSATFTISGVNDNLVDGSQTAIITATANGFDAANGSIQILDDDGDDHGDEAASATATGVPSVSTGIIDEVTDADWFAFSTRSGEDYTFETILGSLPDSLLRLVDTNGTSILAFDDDGGAGFASKITWNAPSSSTYYVVVIPFGANTGTYSLAITGPAAPQETLTVDVVAANISENGSSQAIVSRSGSTSNALTVNLASSDTSEATVPGQVTIPPGSRTATFTVSGVEDALEDGSHTATITASAPGLTSGSDTLVVSDAVVVSDGIAGDDHGNNAGLATPISLPSLTSGAIETVGDVDYFSFVASAGEGYLFETVTGGATLPDTTLAIFGTNGVTQLAFDDNGGFDSLSRILWTAPNSGTYFIRVAGGTAVGTYSLLVVPQAAFSPAQAIDQVFSV